jgi:hypothetical protein
MRHTITRRSNDDSGEGFDVDPSEYIQLLATDFGGIYQVYIAAVDERLKMLRLAMSLLSAPFAVVIALAGAKVIDARALTSWEAIPSFVFATVTAFGLLSVLPYLRLIEATARHMRTARAMNNFRLLYVRELREHFETLGWTPNLPLDPRFPEIFAPLSGPGITVVGLAAVDAAYISVGLLGLSGARPTALVLTAWLVLTTLVLFLVYYIRSNVSRRRKQPSNPFGFPSVEA